MECPYCEKELIYHDYYGFFASHQSGEKIGDIFKCENEYCELFDEHFYTDKEGNLNEGYPC